MKKNIIALTLVLFTVLSMFSIPAKAAAGGIDYTSGKGFSLTIPASWAGKYRTSDFSVAVEFINISNEDAGYGGFLFNIMIQDNLEPLDWNGMKLLGQSGGIYYFGGLPSDVQFDYTNESLMNEYLSMEKDIDAIFKSFRISAASSDGKLTIRLDGAEVATDVAPFIDANDRTMVPVRFISESLGAGVAWDEGALLVTITKGSTVIKLTIGSNQIITNGVAVTMDTTAILVEGRTFVPVRFIAEALGLTVGWDEATNTVILATGESGESGETGAPQTQPPPQPPQTQQPTTSGLANIVVVDEFLLGGVKDSQWIQAEDLARSIVGGERYNLYSMSEFICEGSGSAIWSDGDDDMSGPYAEMLEVTPDRNLWNVTVYLSMTADWEPHLRETEKLSNNNETYKQVVKDILASNGMPGAEPSIMQIFKVDLDGNGKDEVVIYAQNFVTPIPTGYGVDTSVFDDIDFEQGYLLPVGKKGEYSLLFVRKIQDDGSIKNIMIFEQYFPQDGEFQDGCPVLFKLQQFADLNGDGKLEIIAQYCYYEGEGYDVYEISGSEIEWVIGNGIGA